MNVLLYLEVACSVICELLSGVFLINGLIGKKEKIPKLWAIAFVIVAAIYILIVPDNLTTGAYFLTVLYVRYAYEKNWGDSVLITLLNVILVGIIELMCSFPLIFVLNGRWSNIVNNLLASFGCLILGWFLVKFIPIWYVKKWCSRREVICIVVLLFSLLLMFTGIINFHMTLELGLEDYILILFGIVLIWFLCMQLMKYRYEEKVRKKYFAAFCSVIDQMKRRQHKFKNQMDAVYSMYRLYDDYDTLVMEQRKYLGKLADYELPTDVLVLGNPIVIAHLYEKLNEAQEAGIRIRLKLVCDLDECKIDDIHLVEILGTLVDNAIQDMETARESEYLYIEAMQEGRIIILVANPHRKMQNHEMQKMFENGYSTKGENRGVGLYHVRKLVQKYKIDLVVENQIMEGKNYICFSLII